MQQYIEMTIPILSYFTGGGFLDLGFEKEGFTTIWTNEVSSEISKVYSSGMSHIFNKEISIICNQSISDINISLLKKDIVNDIKSKTWGIIGGPPCPDFSVGGKNKGKDGEKGILSQTYVNHICELKPSFFVFENVKGLIRTEKHRQFFLELNKQLIENGYAIDFKLLNSLDFGIPQDRERIILVGIKKDMYKKIYKKKYTDEYNWFPWPKEKYPNAKKTFDWDNITDQSVLDTIPKELQVGEYILDQDKLRKIANSDEYFTPKSTKFNEIKEGDTSRKSFKKLHRHKYSPTAAYGNNEVHLHPVEKRRLSVREALRIQTVPDEYVITGKISLSTKFKVIGNGVPVGLARKIAESMKALLQDINK